MTPHYQDGDCTLWHGDCRDVLAQLPDCSVDSVVTDPPYELNFMGKHWDASGIAYGVDLWREVLRVLKPGGHLLAFGGTRTYHRMAVAIEDAGFEIRDSIHWLYGSGFPKSLDVSKAIDKQRDDRADIYRVTAWVREARDAAGIGNRDIDEAFGANGMGRHWTDVPPHGKQPAVPTLEQVPLLLDVLGLTLDDVPDDIRRLLWDLNGRKGQPGENWWKREVVGTKTVGIANKDQGPRHTIGAGKAVEVPITTPATDAARQWNGWGTALKPAHEPIVVARKPLAGTVAANVLAHGTGALNIDGCRVGSEVRHNPSCLNPGDTVAAVLTAGRETAGRWPANIVFTHDATCDGSCVAGCPVAEVATQSDGASRFFTVTEWDPTADAPFRYVAKPARKERNAEGAVNCTHPTVKPLALMRWLVRLVTPPDGTVLDPFTGSGTTLMAAIHEGFHVVGIEMTDEYLPIIEGRVRWAQDNRPEPTPEQLDLLG